MYSKLHWLFAGRAVIILQQEANVRRRDFAVRWSLVLAGRSLFALSADPRRVTATAIVDGFELLGYADGSVRSSRTSASATPVTAGAVRGFQRVSPRIVAVMARDHTAFLELPALRVAGKVSGLFGGFDDSHRCFLAEEREGAHTLTWFGWPSLQPVCRIQTPHTEGVERVQFAPNLRWSAVYFDSRYPFPDDAFPLDPAIFERDRTTPFLVEMYDLSRCTRVEQFARSRLRSPGRFSSDSAFYEIPNREGACAPACPRFDLTSQLWRD